MRIQPAAVTAALAAAPSDGLITRQAVWIICRNRTTGAPEEIGVWDGDEDFNLSVVRGSDGVTVTRPYYGGGALLKIGDIPRTSDFTIQTVDVDLSQLADVAQLVVRTHDVHRAYVEIHELLMSPDTGYPVTADSPAFIGIVDGAPIRNARAGGEGSAKLKCVSEVMAMLARTNSEKSSYEGQKKRGGDEINLYVGTIETWDISWGQK